MKVPANGRIKIEVVQVLQGFGGITEEGFTLEDKSYGYLDYERGDLFCYFNSTGQLGQTRVQFYGELNGRMTVVYFNIEVTNDPVLDFYLRQGT